MRASNTYTTVCIAAVGVSLSCGTRFPTKTDARPDAVPLAIHRDQRFNWREAYGNGPIHAFGIGADRDAETIALCLSNSPLIGGRLVILSAREEGAPAVEMDVAFKPPPYKIVVCNQFAVTPCLTRRLWTVTWFETTHQRFVQEADIQTHYLAAACPETDRLVFAAFDHNDAMHRVIVYDLKTMAVAERIDVRPSKRRSGPEGIKQIEVTADDVVYLCSRSGFTAIDLTSDKRLHASVNGPFVDTRFCLSRDGTRAAVKLSDSEVSILDTRTLLQEAGAAVSDIGGCQHLGFISGGDYMFLAGGETVNDNLRIKICSVVTGEAVALYEVDAACGNVVGIRSNEETNELAILGGDGEAYRVTIETFKDPPDPLTAD